MTDIIRGGGGGGKSGGGGGRVAVEAPDSLRSKQFARVIDMVSEGEIEGLIDGLSSVYLDDTPVQNPDGSFNFDGVVFDSRTGTQSQQHIEGFPAVEAETAVSVEVKNDAAVVRSITDTEIDAVRVTISVPQLTKQDTTNGDIKGTSVQLAIDVQDDGGGFVPVKIGKYSFTLSDSGSVISSLETEIISASLRVNWSGVTTKTYQSAVWRVDYRAVGDTEWLSLGTGSVSGSSKNEWVQSLRGAWYGGSYQLIAPTKSAVAPFTAAVEDAYEFRVVKVSGSGSFDLSGTGVGWRGFDIISGKTSSRYQRSYRVDLPGSGPWDIRVRRLTADSSSSALQNKTFWDSYTTLVDSKFRYPNSALMALSIDAEKFQSIPTRAYHIRGIIVQVPSNYDPVTREYDGVWNGTFTPAWTNNPAWVFYDLITNDRYGLGNKIPADQVDKWGLYAIAQYCDEMVDDGVGGVEPRFICNVYLQERSDATNLLQALASSFRALMFWMDGAITAVQDSPKQPVALFTPANIVDGAFDYASSGASTRHTVALVTWNDPSDLYRQSIEYVSDDEGISRYGVVQTEVVAMGCTSRGQAHRFGRALLFAERMETETVSFKAGLSGLAVAPGEVIQTSDPVRAGQRLGGRILSATLNAVTLDSDIAIESGKSYTLWVVLPDGTVESRSIINAVGTSSLMSVSPDFSDEPLNLAMWVVGISDLIPETWRVMSIAEVDDVNAEITALEYRSDKYDAIDNNLALEPRVTTGLTAIPDAPQNVQANEALYLVNSSVVATRIELSWEGNAASYEIQHRETDGNWITVNTQNTSIEIGPVDTTEHEIKLAAKNLLGARSQIVSLSKTIYGLTAPPVNVTGFRMTAIAGNAHFAWNAATDLDVIVGGNIRIRHTKETVAPEWSNAVDIGGVIAGKSTSAVLPLINGTYLAKFVDSSGNQSSDAVAIVTTAPSIIKTNLVDTVTENPSFAGSKTNLVVDGGGNLILDDTSEIGVYLFDNSVDLLSIQTSRLTVSIDSIGFDTADLIGSRGLISGWQSVTGATVSDVGVDLYVRTSQDGITFSDWESFVVGDYTARAFQFKAELFSNYATHNIAIASLSVTVDMPDRIESDRDLTSGAAAYNVTYSDEFIQTPSVGITAQDMATGDYYELSNKTTEGFDVTFKNASGTTISRVFDYFARGY